MVDTVPQTPSRIIYAPPPVEELNAFARRVCRELGEEYTTQEVMEGLSTFIRVAANIQAKHLNRKNLGQLDNDQPAG